MYMCAYIHIYVYNMEVYIIVAILKYSASIKTHALSDNSMPNIKVISSH